jgi:hypothetical protein
MCIALLLRVSVGFVLARKEEEEGGYDAPPLLCFETNNNMGGTMCFCHFLLHEQNKTQGDLLPSLLLPL